MYVKKIYMRLLGWWKQFCEAHHKQLDGFEGEHPYFIEADKKRFKDLGEIRKEMYRADRDTRVARRNIQVSILSLSMSPILGYLLGRDLWPVFVVLSILWLFWALTSRTRASERIEKDFHEKHGKEYDQLYEQQKFACGERYVGPWQLPLGRKFFPRKNKNKEKEPH